MADNKHIKISIIIPTLNEELLIGKLLGSIDKSLAEVIVADGGSTDDTIKIATSSGAIIVENIKSGRGSQMDSGAKIARGDILLFLHCDTRLPHNWLNIIIETINTEGVIGGAFTFKTDGVGIKFRVLEKFVKIRNNLLGLVYGDQGIFVIRDVFHKIGGFRSLPLMEDVDCLRRLRKRGKFIVIKDEIITSSRRWEKNGFFKNTLRNSLYILLYFIGIKPSSIYKFYYG